MESVPFVCGRWIGDSVGLCYAAPLGRSHACNLCFPNPVHLAVDLAGEAISAGSNRLGNRLGNLRSSMNEHIHQYPWKMCEYVQEQLLTVGVNAFRYGYCGTIVEYLISLVGLYFAAELGRNSVSKHQIQPEYGDEQADAGRDG